MLHFQPSRSIHIIATESVRVFMKRSRGTDDDLPIGPVWNRPAKRNPAFLIVLLVSVPGRIDPLRLTIDPWFTIEEIIDEVDRRCPLPARWPRRLTINGIVCEPRRQISHYTIWRETSAILDVAAPAAGGNDAAAPASGSDAVAPGSSGSDAAAPAASGDAPLASSSASSAAAPDENADPCNDGDVI